MSDEKFEENSVPQDYAAPQDYSDPGVQTASDYSNAGSQVDQTAAEQQTESQTTADNWQNMGEQPQQLNYQNQGTYQNQPNYQNTGSYQSQPNFQEQGAYQNQPNYQNQNGTWNNGEVPGGDPNAWKQQYINPQAQAQQQQQKQEPGKGFAIASMILGIISLVLFCSCINVPLAIAATILAVVQFVKNGKNGMAIAGMITGILSIVLCVVFWVVVLMKSIDETNGYSFPEYWEEEFQNEFDDSF